MIVNVALLVKEVAEEAVSHRVQISVGRVRARRVHLGPWHRQNPLRPQIFLAQRNVAVETSRPAAISRIFTAGCAFIDR